MRPKKIDPELEKDEKMEPVDPFDLQMRALDRKLDATLESILRPEEMDEMDDLEEEGGESE